MVQRIIFLSVILLVTYTQVFCQDSPSDIKLQLITDQLTHPTAFATTSTLPNRLFVCEQEGRIRIVENGKLLATPFLDISGEIIKKAGYEERGLLGMAFHPNYAQNGKFYLYCSVPVVPAIKGIDHRSQVREYVVSKTNPLLAEKASLYKVIEFDEPQSNHNGGDLKFGPDGLLYISAGDGGGQNDQHGEYGNAQNLSNVLGKILRIDINQRPYTIPGDNPFVGKVDGHGQGAHAEIYAYGFRNPWRISFDRKTGQLFTGDVGQDTYEEVDIVTKGGNYGWRPFEGMHAYRPNDPQPSNPITPIMEYPHQEGLSITGGFVYRGKALPQLTGNYIFADWTGPVWRLSPTENNAWVRRKLSISQPMGYWHIYSFGEDTAGELYLLTVLLDKNKGALYKLVP